MQGGTKSPPPRCPTGGHLLKCGPSYNRTITVHYKSQLPNRFKMSAIRFGPIDHDRHTAELLHQQFNFPALPDDKMFDILSTGDEKKALLVISNPEQDLTTQDNRAIIMACNLGLTRVVKKLLESPEVDPSAQHNRAIIEAAEQGHAEVVSLLLADGRADPSDQDNKALHVARAGGHTDVVSLLLEDPSVI